ncbi:MULTISPECIES: ABC transporter ATP-binding protein [Haloferax]|uniref:ABC-type D-xylose/L-arabinose transporter n=6 Tax=Haloferax TaxID=2251 RepID=A0A6C0UW08_HALVO|nr:MULTISPECIES: ABC transporter ATP-binding protein [Haloferax]ELK52292.1 putative sugar ABC transporter ATP-binding protein [Haloferax sp. BAB-2207]ELZ86322.1 putative sugar ABC transporter ATP-binding protein [Haloferax alexandrinus JCM 10717]MBC9987371.1 ABC transporter ATP-binding protein [Haloferax sp. AS1]NLV04302.1 ATP-binding cassette domain-containing protein [Haloferax alexandrinus]QIB79735.1 ABC transporter ATP-binding protein [Haloferax alexandrinus]
MGDVTLEHVSKHYDDVTAVDDMNLDIDDGEFICLVGPSGCGKSTTMEMIAGLTIPSEGKVFIGDREVTNLPPKDRGVAMVFQNIALFPHMDVYDNISFGLRLRNYDKEEIERRVERAAEIVQLQGMLERMPDEMSGGQRQRVAIARAIVRNPGVFLMDEPLANLDAKLRVHMRTELQRLHKELDTTIIYVTHDQAEAMTMSDRIAVIDSGQLQQIDPPLVCYNEPANLFVAGFIGSPSMNFLDGEVAADGFSSTNIDVEFDPADLGVEPGTDVTMGIRPEDVYLVDEESLVSNPSHRIDAVTDVLEPMGDEIFVYLKLSESAETDLEDTSGVANDQLLMSVAPDTDIAEDEDVTVVLDRSRVHLFDTATGEAISHGIETPVQTSGAPGTEAESDD